MKKIWTISTLLFALVLFFSCSKDDTGEWIKQDTFTPVTLKFSSALGVNTAGGQSGTIESKAGEAADIYTADNIYLMIEDDDASEGWVSYPMILQASGESANFDIYISTISPNEIAIHNGNNAPVRIHTAARLYFSSTPDVTIMAETSPDKLTPNGNPTLEPYGENLFRSDIFTIEVLPNGVKLFGHSFTEGDDISFTLTVYRQTGLLKVNLILFRKTEEKPSLVTSGHFNPDCSEVGYWQITPYLRNYAGAIRMDDRPMDPPVKGVYMLSNDYLSFGLEQVTAMIGNVLFDHKTHGAFSDSNPYLFSGSLSGSTIEFMIVNTKPEIPESLIASVPLENVTLGYNELRTINVFMNISVLEENFTSRRDLRAVPLDGDEEIIPDIFYYWE